MSPSEDTIEAAKLLDKAADVIERNGWVKGGWYESETGKPPEQCRVCAGAAINVAGGFFPDDLDHSKSGAAYEAAHEFAVRVVPDVAKNMEFADQHDVLVGLDELLDAIGYWNDAPGRTAEQVIAELRACAADLRKEGQ